MAVVNPWDYKKGFIIINAAGRMGPDYEAAFRWILVRALDSGERNIAINMSRVWRTPVTDDIWPILKLLPEAQERGIRLKLLYPWQVVRTLLETRKVLNRFDLYRSEEDMFRGLAAS